MSDEPVKMDIRCAHCDRGEVMFADCGEIYDGEIADCDTCGKPNVAVGLTDGRMVVMVYDDAE
jgi:hypothetical protein